MAGYDISDPTLKGALDKALLKTAEALQAWPDSGNGAKNALWCLNKLKLWQKATERYTDLKIPCLITVALTSMIDLDERVKDQAKKDMLTPTIDALQVADDWFDAKGRSFGYYETADEVMGLLYGIIGF